MKIYSIVINNLYSTGMHCGQLIPKGTLWDSARAYDKVAEHLGTKIHSIGARQANSKYDVFCSYAATSEFLERLSKVIIFGKPEQSPVL